MTTATHTPAKPVGASITRPNLTSVGTIVWLSSEVMFFAGLFAMYFTLRATSPEVWAENTEILNVPMASVNTLILVLSSVTCQFGVFAAERLQPRRTGGLFQVSKWGLTEWFALTFLMGAVFVSVQVYEYASLVSEGVTIAASAYGSAFYITTGFHALHVTGGLIAFLFIMGRAFVAKRFGHYEATSAIVVSYYWHFVDVVWIVLFFLVYFIK
ncbi:cytochrome c oxidase subunit III [Kocuria rhizophila]|uniref:cytochrome-c oxidase n=1 Tax=Kocuria rhizophila (strain ATCC 9341 / DSM 348 / NBRC 103217 / DC2201) TaxID=378753 RepID=B2GHS4_KOCRD|nr:MULTISPECIES: heme-copper oxidase subunit III [Kocuria]HAG62845.1 heme-copper oxidase subunit III [Kocuria sp.]ASE10490.1 heme-copper oxidase subunit III [Kocuria rhizophila]MBK4120391.1 heme-copper oxidase subunit III [Kocuria rhizophila]MCC5671681.1 heme-copper oxidase subunit III [Kocuria rhizophila]MCC5674353.1 heme-copper oxidase subunit III [Kocuria rhizophila]